MEDPSPVGRSICDGDSFNETKDIKNAENMKILNNGYKYSPYSPAKKNRRAISHSGFVDSGSGTEFSGIVQSLIYGIFTPGAISSPSESAASSSAFSAISSERFLMMESTI